MQIRLKQLAIAIAATGLTGAAFAQGAAGTYSDGGQQHNPAAQAQQGQQGQGFAPDAAATEVSDDELEKFASAHKQVEEIREKYVSEAQAADDPEKVAEVQMNMQQEMVQAVQDEGLDVGTYNRIAQMLPYDDELRQRVEGML
ncbi:MAG: hypothetical protein C0462_01995 [Alcanivorax sp.]|uniref:DUF4168 domain-containing protein n=1 Tax=Isoalcanivorax indicus TaxID=2202653 RepID=UPI000DB9A6E9|nr:DUF4168 domain-containing protein [Isoalcanivorax indicus]MBA3979352.1 hypothetical protein [Alcanivorax sp.]